MTYLDHAASTPIVEEALEAMLRAARDGGGNPASVHGAGRKARAALDEARIQVADYLGCMYAELRWEASGTAALGRALRAALSLSDGPVVSSRLEHPAVRTWVEEVEATGREVRWLPQPAGAVAADEASQALEGAAVVALSAMNHELGTAPALEPLLERAPGAWWVVDAVQAAAWRDVRPLLGPRVFLACSAQKLGGPPGVAALRVPRELAFVPAGRREAPFPESPGTPPWLAAIGMGTACRVRGPALREGLPRVRALAERLLGELREACPDLVHNAGPDWLGPILDVSVPGVEARRMESALDLRGLCVARTSACQQARVASSPVVAAAYPDEPWRADTALRFSLGLGTTDADVAVAVEAWRSALEESRPEGPPR
ncbi:cysteine desulfurase family protein [Corallococcus exiguus]|uniref:cysteine desulfurase family protein n=1 Tax=Corallococcus exiguus TaxID=83462 RepID=UPI0015613221|nr:aminotransferase class V-fold PLP-dependent enzyme [Corallococcus exiguus]